MEPVFEAFRLQRIPIPSVAVPKEAGIPNLTQSAGDRPAQRTHTLLVRM